METRICVVKKGEEDSYWPQRKCWFWWEDFDKFGSFSRDAIYYYDTEFGSVEWAKKVIDLALDVYNKPKPKKEISYIDYP